MACRVGTSGRTPVRLPLQDQTVSHSALAARPESLGPTMRTDEICQDEIYQEVTSAIQLADRAPSIHNSQPWFCQASREKSLQLPDGFVRELAGRVADQGAVLRWIKDPQQRAVLLDVIHEAATAQERLRDTRPSWPCGPAGTAATTGAGRESAQQLVGAR